MNEPRSQQIAQALVDAVSGISTGAGFYFDWAQPVSRRRFSIAEIGQLVVPCASVWMGEWTQGDPKDRCINPAEWQIRREAVVDLWWRSVDPEDVDRDGLRLEADVLRAVMATGVLGLSSFVSAVVPMRGRTDHQEYGDRGLGWKAVGFAVSYTDTASAP